MAAGFFATTGSTGPAEGQQRLVPACGACKLDRGCAQPRQAWRGEGRRGILLVASSPTAAPGGLERPFGGTAGTGLREAMARHGVSMDLDCWQVGAVACRPPDDRWPTGAEVGYCSPLLAQALQELQPTTVITFGYAPTAAIVRGAGISAGDPGDQLWPGWRIPDQRLNAWVCPLYAVDEVTGSKESDVMGVLQGHYLAEALQQRARPWPGGAPEWRHDVRRYYSDAEAAAAIRLMLARALAQGGAIAVDYETNMLKPDPADARIVCCALAWGHRSVQQCIAYPWGPLAREATGEVLRSPVPKVAANMKFEDRWTRCEFGHPVRGWAWDTMNEAHVMDNRRGITGVKFQAYVLLGQPDYSRAVKPYLEAPGTMAQNRIAQLDMRQLLLYCGLDALLEFYIALRQARLMQYRLPWLTGEAGT